jgi:Protein of unknown function (DUF3738)
MSVILKSHLPLALLPVFLSAQSFEVAEIKPHDPKSTLVKGKILPGGRLEAAGMTLQDLLMFAYGLLPDYISGLPKWAKEAQFDIVAKAGREDQKVMPAYVIAVGKDGPKLQRASGGMQHCAWTALPDGVTRRECQNMTTAELAEQLPGLGGMGIDLPVVDQTGLDGAWDFHLDVKLAPPNTATAAPEPEGPTIFDAFDQAGLKLERRKVSLPVLVIDHAEPLSEN